MIIAVGFLTVFKFEMNLNVIAALLTLVGYSVNDTIVIFDRARENLVHRRKEPLATILNDSLNQTLTRTIISNGTTFLTVLGLFLFGGEVLRGFGFAMVVGIVIGTYSTLFIAVPLVSWWYGRKGGTEVAAAAVKTPAKAAKRRRRPRRLGSSRLPFGRRPDARPAVVFFYASPATVHARGSSRLAGAGSVPGDGALRRPTDWGKSPYAESGHRGRCGSGAQRVRRAVPAGGRVLRCRS